MTLATNFVTAALSAALVGLISDGSGWEAALAALLTGFVVMTILIRVNP